MTWINSKYTMIDHALMIHYEKIKPKSAYENMWIYYIVIVVNLLHVSVTYCDHFRQVFYDGYITKTYNVPI